MKRFHWLVVLMLLVSLVGCGAAQSSTPMSASIVDSISTPAVTSAPLVLNISPLAPVTEEAPNAIDQENQRVSDTAFSNLSDNDSFRFDLNLTAVYDHQPDHVEFVLKGNGAFTGLGQTDQPGFTASLSGTLQANGKTYQFTADTRFVGRKLYIMVTATNADGETRSTPWSYLDIDQSLDQLTQSSPLLKGSAGVPDSVQTFSPAKIENFFGLLDFSRYITRTRLADEPSGVIHFQNEIDLKGLLSSREFLQLSQLVAEATGQTPEPLPEDQINQMLTLMRQQLDDNFPTLDILFHQYVNPKVLTMNRLTLEVDLVAKDGTVVNANTVIHFSNHGDTITITAPTDAVPLETLKVEPFSNGG